MAEKQQNHHTPTDFERAADEALAIAAQAGPAPERTPSDDFMYQSARASEAVVSSPNEPALEQQTTETSRGKKVLKAVGYGAGAVAVGGAVLGLADMALDAVDHQIQHNQEVGEEALKQQQDADYMLDNNVIHIDNQSKSGK